MGSLDRSPWRLLLAIVLPFVTADYVVATEPVTKAAPLAPAMGKLNIEGKAIKKVVLLRMVADPKDPANIPIFQESPRSVENPEHPSNQVILERPASTISLPVGKYLLTGVELDGGFQCVVSSVYFDIDTGAPRARGWESTEFLITPDKPCSIKIGTPFKPTVTITRRDSTLLLEYRLTDAGGHTYFCSAWDKPPAALIDGKIVSGPQMFVSKPSEKSPQFTITCNGQEVGGCTCEFGHAGNFWHLWPVPVSVLGGPLKIVASFDLGKYGPTKTEPVFVEWHWYYHFWPHHAGWILIFALLILIAENRNWWAWTILIVAVPLSEILIPWFGHADRSSREGIAFWQAVVTAWTAVWLLGPWLAKCRQKYIAFVALVPVWFVGMAVQFRFQQNLLELVLQPGWLIASVLVFLPILAAFALTARCCGRSYRPGRFMAWLLLWLMAGFAVVLLICFLGVFLWQEDVPPRGRPDALFSLIIGPLMMGLVVYLFNLPFMLLAFFCPPYRERFRKVLRLSDPLSSSLSEVSQAKTCEATNS